jgi:hypothetical protein
VRNRPARRHRGRGRSAPSGLEHGADPGLPRPRRRQPHLNAYFTLDRAGRWPRRSARRRSPPGRRATPACRWL